MRFFNIKKKSDFTSKIPKIKILFLRKGSSFSKTFLTIKKKKEKLGKMYAKKVLENSFENDSRESGHDRWQLAKWIDVYSATRIVVPDFLQ